MWCRRSIIYDFHFWAVERSLNTFLLWRGHCVWWTESHGLSPSRFTPWGWEGSLCLETQASWCLSQIRMGLRLEHERGYGLGTHGVRCIAHTQSRSCHWVAVHERDGSGRDCWRQSPTFVHSAVTEDLFSSKNHIPSCEGLGVLFTWGLRRKKG